MQFMKHQHILRCVIPEDELWERYEIDFEENEDECADDETVFSEKELTTILTDVIKEATIQGYIGECSGTLNVKTTILEDGSLEVLLAFPKDSPAFAEQFNNLPGTVKKINNYENSKQIDGSPSDNLPTGKALEKLLSDTLFNPSVPDEKIRYVADFVAREHSDYLLIPLKAEGKAAFYAALFFLLRDFAAQYDSKMLFFSAVVRDCSEKFFDSPETWVFSKTFDTIRKNFPDSPMIVEYDKYLSYRTEYLKEYGRNIVYWAHLKNIEECMTFYQKAQKCDSKGKALYKDIDDSYYMQMLLPAEILNKDELPLIPLSDYADELYIDNDFEPYTLFEHGKCILKDKGFELLADSIEHIQEKTS